MPRECVYVAWYTYTGGKARESLGKRGRGRAQRASVCMWLVTRIQGEKPEKALAREGEAELSARVCVCDLLHGKRELKHGEGADREREREVWLCEGLCIFYQALRVYL